MAFETVRETLFRVPMTSHTPFFLCFYFSLSLGDFIYRGDSPMCVTAGLGGETIEMYVFNDSAMNTMLILILRYYLPLEGEGGLKIRLRS